MPPLFQAVATKLNELVQGEFDIVPIPNSSARVKDKAEFKTRHMRAQWPQWQEPELLPFHHSDGRRPRLPLIKEARATPKFIVDKQYGQVCQQQHLAPPAAPAAADQPPATRRSDLSVGVARHRN